MLGRSAIESFLAALLAALAGGALAQPAPLTAAAVTLTPVDANPVLVPGEEGAWDAVSIRFPTCSATTAPTTCSTPRSRAGNSPPPSATPAPTTG